MQAIYIPQLAKAPERTEALEVKEYFPDLETLTPVQGKMRVVHQGKYLEVTATAETIVTLTCDRCLQQYNHRLAVQTSELIWLEEPEEDLEAIPLEREITLEELVETLPPEGMFDPGEWLYQQLCLEIPLRKLCDQACGGIQVGDNISGADAIDRRWASLQDLKKHLSN